MSIKRRYWVLSMYCLISFPLFSQSIYLELNLNDVRGGNLFARAKSPLEALKVIEKAANDDKVKGIILNIGAISHNREYLWELRTALEQFKSKDKKIVAFINSADIDIYCLASVADKIVIDELGTLTMLGYSVGMGYAKQALEKLGIGVRELRYFEYKSAVEMFARTTMSDADRKQYGDYLDDIFNLTRRTLINARNWTIDEFNSILDRDFMFSARGALSRNLVDRIGRKDAVLEMIREIEGEEIKNFALYGETSSSLTGSMTKYAPPKAGGIFSRPPVIAVVYANGQTDMERGMAAQTLSQTVRELADNKRVKAIVIRMDSPGGSAVAADFFNEAVRYAKEKKPVVVSMGQVAASGGYWASMNASHIMATPYTITGSIGVIASWFYDDGLNNKLGINFETLQRGAHADMMSGFLVTNRDLSAHEEERYKEYILDIYNVFTEKVATSRNMELAKVEEVSQGRIFSGTSALDVGLIDSVGSLSDAIRIARQLAEISEGTNVRFREYPEPKFMDRMLERIPIASIFFKNRKSQTNPALLITDLLLPDMNISYRLENNGKVMPILPLEFLVK